MIGVFLSHIRRARRFALVVLTIAAAVLGQGMAGHASEWTVDYDASRIGFSSTHAGRAFDGVFRKWTADIRFDPDNLEQAKAEVAVDLASAVTGDMTYDKTLPTADWFDIAKFAEARFITNEFRKTGDGTFEADGTLDMRGAAAPVTLSFSFTRNGEEAVIEGTTRLSRLAYGIGRQSDASGAWVGLDVPVQVKVTMARVP